MGAKYGVAEMLLAVCDTRAKQRSNELRMERKETGCDTIENAQRMFERPDRVGISASELR